MRQVTVFIVLLEVEVQSLNVALKTIWQVFQFPPLTLGFDSIAIVGDRLVFTNSNTIVFNKEPKFGRRVDTRNNPLDWFTQYLI